MGLGLGAFRLRVQGPEFNTNPETGPPDASSELRLLLSELRADSMLTLIMYCAQRDVPLRCELGILSTLKYDTLLLGGSYFFLPTYIIYRDLTKT